MTLNRPSSSPRLTAVLVAGVLLGACAATTRVTITPPDQASVCQPQAGVKAAVFWRTQWRADQKDVPDREAAAVQGITRFFAEAGCFASVDVARTEAVGSTFEVPAGKDRLVVLTVRELGPTVKLLSSAALVEGGTEVVVDVAVVRPGLPEPQQQFSIHWQDGGPGVVKGIQTLPSDMTAALKAGLLLRQGR